MEFQDMVVLVTGSNSGIGLACARVLLGRGSRVAINGRNLAKLQSSRAAMIEADPSTESRILAVAADVTDDSAVGEMFDRVEQQWGPVSALVNNAGITGGRLTLAEITPQSWDNIVSANLRGMYLCTRRALPAMYERRWGRVVNISSIAGVSGKLRSSTHYAATKGAIVAFTRKLSMEAAPKNVAVNCVAPGLIEQTGFTTVVKGQLLAEYLRNIPAGRPGTCEEIAELVAFLCSRHAGYIIGQAIVADGGAST